MSTLLKNEALGLAYASFGKMLRSTHHSMQLRDKNVHNWVEKIKLGEWDERQEITVKLVLFTQLYDKHDEHKRALWASRLSEAFFCIGLQTLARQDGDIGRATERLYDAFEIGFIHDMPMDTPNRCVRRLVGDLDRDLPKAAMEFFRLLKLVNLTLPELEKSYFGCSLEVEENIPV